MRYALILLLIARAWAAASAADQPFSIDKVAVTLNGHGIEGEAAAAIMEIFRTAHAEPWPLTSLHARLQEGLVKQAPPAKLAETLRQHAHYLGRAWSMVDVVRSEGRGRRSPSRQPLVILLAQALESGVDQAHLAALLDSARGIGDQRVRALIEASEYLALAGETDDQIRFLVSHMQEQEIGRMEILRTTHRWVEALQRGLPVEERIRQIR